MRVATIEVLLSLGFVFGCSASAGDPAETSGSGGVSSGGSATTSGGSPMGAAPAGGSGGNAATTGGVSSAGSSTAGASSGGVTNVAGSSSGGGSAGGPHYVGECDGLGAVDEFEDITPPDAGSITKVQADPVHSGTLYVGTDKKGLFKSTDCGASWAKINTGESAAILDSGTLWFVLIDPVQPDVLYASALYGTDPSLYKSENGGVDFTPLFPPGSEVANTVDYNFFQWASMDPSDHQHLLVSFHANCSGPKGPECLGETFDSGATWNLLKGPLGGWGEGVGPIIIGGDEIILGTSQEGIYYSSNGGDAWEKVGPGIHGIPYVAANGNYYSGSDYGTLTSTDGHVWDTVPSAPSVFTVIGDGTRLFSGKRYLDDAGQPYYTSLETDGATWTPLASPAMSEGVVEMVYDADHQLLYSANTGAGLWRMVTQ